MSASPHSWIASQSVRDRLQEVEQWLTDEVCPEDPEMYEVVTHLIQGGGKRLRPALLLICAHLGPSVKPEVVALAGAVEWLHTATLYHDDVMDEASQRRFRPSANNLWGNRMAVIAGNYLYARAGQVFAEAGSAISRVFTRSALDVWDGQMLETELTFDLQTDESHYLRAIEKKTAALFEMPCQVGALLAEAPPEIVEAVGRFGRLAGLAFQVVDDLNDLFGTNTRLGKPVATDLLEGVYTLPVIYALAGSETSQGLRDRLTALRAGQERVENVVAWVRGHPASGQTVAKVCCWVEAMKQCLEVLPPGDCRQSLENFADQIYQRIPVDL